MHAHTHAHMHVHTHNAGIKRHQNWAVTDQNYCKKRLFLRPVLKAGSEGCYKMFSLNGLQRSVWGRTTCLHRLFLLTYWSQDCHAE